ncbi:MAG TPA: PQQ-dependent sugar dehydrogenase [Vicinamibacterales bacterium]|jgi:glucose/arabinose dehydrogenase|nr:PQQ-dependent sugar dehydrogenase [Vicinamibacterales bacterium]
MQTERRYQWLSIVMACAVVGAVTSALVAQQNTVLPQPVASKLPPPGKASPKPSRGSTRAEGSMPSVPAGFTVTAYADLPSPRMMVYAPNGDLFVSSPGTNSITVLRDANNDGTFEARGTYAQGAAAPPRGGGGGGGGNRGAGAGRGQGGAPPGFGQPPAVLGSSAPACAPPPNFVERAAGTLAAPFGMAFHDGYLYVGNTGSLVRYKYANGDLQAQGDPEKLMDLPTGGHSTRNVIFNRAGTKMYVAVGSQSNNDAGEDCRRAAILEFNPDGTGYRVFASGIRNPVGLALQPGTDVLWTAMNERDNLGDDLVPDYATSVKDGGFYGWPYSYIGSNYDPRYVGAFPDLVKRTIVPDVLFPAHSAALGITFYTGTQFPQRYRNGGFVALHGSWNRSVASGYRVAFFPMVNGKPGPIEDFLTGFLSEDGTNGAPITQWGRPVGVLTSRDGGLLVSDDTGNRIWKVVAK